MLVSGHVRECVCVFQLVSVGQLLGGALGCVEVKCVPRCLEMRTALTKASAARWTGDAGVGVRVRASVK